MESGRAAGFHHKQVALLRSEVQRPRSIKTMYGEKKLLLDMKYAQNQLEAMGSVYSGHTYTNLLSLGLMTTFLYLHHDVYSGTL